MLWASSGVEARLEKLRDQRLGGGCGELSLLGPAQPLAPQILLPRMSPRLGRGILGPGRPHRGPHLEGGGIWAGGPLLKLVTLCRWGAGTTVSST